MKNLRIKNSEDGVSLIITFFIMIIILAVVFSVSIILYSEIKVIRNIGDSVVAFYVADSGVEKIIYYDRQVIPVGATGSKRGICYMCNSAVTGDTTHIMDPDCKSILAPADDPTGCSSTKCENCTVTFNPTNLSTGKKYSLVAKVSPTVDPGSPSMKFSNLSVDSTGEYKHSALANPVKRAIHLDFEKDETGDLAPTVVVDSSYVNFKTQQSGESIDIFAYINDFGHGIKSVIANISTNDKDYGNTNLIPQSGVATSGTYKNSQPISGLPTGSYYVKIIACDLKDNCSAPTLILGRPK